MHPALLKYFENYSKTSAPFMHDQLKQWGQTRPLDGLKVEHQKDEPVDTHHEGLTI